MQYGLSLFGLSLYYIRRESHDGCSVNTPKSFCQIHTTTSDFNRLFRLPSHALSSAYHCSYSIKSQSPFSCRDLVWGYSPTALNSHTQIYASSMATRFNQVRWGRPHVLRDQSVLSHRTNPEKAPCWPEGLPSSAISSTLIP